MRKIKPQAGATLVELLVALGLGVALSSVAVQLYVLHGGVLNTSRALSQIQEQGRYAQQFLSVQLKMSGRSRTEAAITAFAFSERSDGVANDVLSIHMPRGGSDCMGGRLNHEASVFYKTFYVKGDTLMCTDSDGIRAPVIQNVERFQVVYGVDLDDSVLHDSGYGSADAYVDGSVLLSSSARVVSVRFALTLKSDKPVVSVSPSEQKSVWILSQPYANQYTHSADGYLRRVFVATTALRNVVHRGEI